MPVISTTEISSGIKTDIVEECVIIIHDYDVHDILSKKNRL